MASLATRKKLIAQKPSAHEKQEMASKSDNNQSSDPSETQPLDSKPRLSFFHILTSVMAAAIGVQNQKNQERDFNAKGSIYIYIAAGIIFTALFVASVALVVTAVLNNAA